jgi:riboflavin kinase / FMN adenylyltransferase
MIHQDTDSPDVIDALSVGNIRKANELMQSAYRIRAKVVHGNHLGRSLGYPTANLQLQENKPFLLANGVYTVKTEFNRLIYNGMANVGIRPTIAGKTLTIEVHLFDFSGNLYGKTLIVSFFDRIRDEMKFGTLDLLIQQLNQDKKEAFRLLSSGYQPDSNP